MRLDELGYELVRLATVCRCICEYYRTLLDRYQKSQCQTVVFFLAGGMGMEIIQAKVIGAMENT